ncbi:MAG TPA: peptidyl-prolyl cis-trans isomerase [Thermoanaerobaculia bacterium]|jgi:parvulin-like peptidyl-prolyl isomerase
MKKTVLAIAIMLSAASLSAADLVEAIVIRVGDRIITRTQYEKRLRESYADIDNTVAPADRDARKAAARAGLLDEMIGELLLKDRADRLGINVSADEIKEAVNRLKQQYGMTTDEQFQKSLAESGMTRADMESRLRDSIITSKVFARELRGRQDLSDAELRERYNREKEQYRLPERAKLREIVILKPSDESKLEEARTRATEVAAAARLANADFAKLATTMSESGTKEQGGSMGEVAKGELLPDLDKAVFNANAGTVVGPIESRAAWHIMKIEERLPSEVPGFDTVKERLRREANDETFQRDLKAYIDGLRKEAFIQVNEANVPGA